MRRSNRHAQTLPIHLIRDQLIESVQHNTVTIILGNTGCGKSSQVPQILSDRFHCSVLCTQPRRLAAVALAERVAEERGAILGGDDVGYHIGQRNVSNPSTKILFSTAGVLWEQLCKNNLSNLPYEYICLDEVHERSSESDLVLTALQLLLRKKTKSSIRLVIMSATFNVNTYQDYFHACSSKVIRVPELVDSTMIGLPATRVLYLDQVQRLAGGRILQSEEIASDVQPEIWVLLTDLIRCIDDFDDDNGAVLVFIPTYHLLERAFQELMRSMLPVRLHVLHSSIDVQRCVDAIHQAAKRKKRAIVLSSNISESSVTIEGCAHVIDLCRTVNLSWNEQNNRYQSSMVWCSHSQCEQRKGRTGRTCAGTVYRLVQREQYEAFDEYETPDLVLSSLRNETLQLICSSGSPLLCDVRSFYKSTLTPPQSHMVEHAVSFLESVSLARSTQKRFRPTEVGELVAALPFPIEASLLVLKGARANCLYETILVSSVHSNTPYPIEQCIDKNRLSRNNQVADFGAKVDSKDTVELFLANLAAFEMYRRKFPVEERVDCSEIAFWEVSEKEEGWCRRHHLVPNAVRTVIAMIDLAVGVFERFRPVVKNTPTSFLEKLYPCLLPGPAHPHSFSCDPKGDVCSKKPYAHYERMDMDLDVMKGLIRDMFPRQEETETSLSFFAIASGQPACRFFLLGRCNYGASCRFPHSFAAKRPPCKSGESCRFGLSCLFSHDSDEERNRLPPSSSSSAAEAIEFDWEPKFGRSQIMSDDHKCWMLLQCDDDFSRPFFEALRRNPLPIITDDVQRILHSPQVTDIFWTVSDEPTELEIVFSLVQRRCRLASALQPHPRLFVLLGNDRFSRWNVVNVARYHSLYVRSSNPLVLDDFPAFESGFKRLVVYEFIFRS